MEIKNYEKTKTIILVSLAVATVLAIGLGTLFRNANIFGNKKHKLGNVVENTVAIDGDFDQIVVGISIAEFKVEYGDKPSLYYKIPEKLVPQIKTENGILVIDNDTVNIDFLNSMKDAANVDYCLILTIPEGEKYKKVDFDVDCGDIRLAKINTEEFSLEADCGNIEIKGIEAKDVKIENSMGNIDVSDAKFDKGVFSLDMGDLKVNGDFDEVTADCAMGAIEVFTTRPESEVKLNLDVNLGSVIVNGKNWNH